jgi:hypothetical protein
VGCRLLLTHLVLPSERVASILGAPEEDKRIVLPRVRVGEVCLGKHGIAVVAPRHLDAGANASDVLPLVGGVVLCRVSRAIEGGAHTRLNDVPCMCNRGDAPYGGQFRSMPAIVVGGDMGDSAAVVECAPPRLVHAPLPQRMAFNSEDMPYMFSGAGSEPSEAITSFS